MKKCKDCKNWDYQSDNFGFCRANAPCPSVVAKSSEYVLVWPSTGKDDWCGQFKVEEA